MFSSFFHHASSSSTAPHALTRLFATTMTFSLLRLHMASLLRPSGFATTQTTPEISFSVPEHTNRNSPPITVLGSASGAHDSLFLACKQS